MMWRPHRQDYEEMTKRRSDGSQEGGQKQPLRGFAAERRRKMWAKGGERCGNTNTPPPVDAEEPPMRLASKDSVTSQSSEPFETPSMSRTPTDNAPLPVLLLDRLSSSFQMFGRMVTPKGGHSKDMMCHQMTPPEKGSPIEDLPLSRQRSLSLDEDKLHQLRSEEWTTPLQTPMTPPLPFGDSQRMLFRRDFTE
eukprot:TRINITY_DN93381_c0_g1_i1.p1 TRINITY_DN93381_c0_g1~~TRINITY_DN93381_c0_g1_i1.p1  ORF type:complete len:194 (+),score=38.76 TRINITY_DN93381_c0_g1_i1:116-697(+)